MGRLFKKDVKDLKFGVTPGTFVAHLVEDDTEEVAEVGQSPELSPEQQSAEVTRSEVYSNIGEIRTGQFFMALATQIEKDYEYYSDYNQDPDMANIMISIKDYITAPGRSAQQDAYKMVRMRMLACEENYEKKMKDMVKKDKASVSKQEFIDLKLKREKLNKYAASFQAFTNGNLKIPEEQKEAIENAPVHNDPKDVALGRLTQWRSTTNTLFPHDPSPNDIKQGVSIFDCYVLSVITQLAANDPDYIKNMMKDNGDGTVTVRFFDKYNDHMEDQDENGKKKNRILIKEKPVFIKVNKTTNKDLMGHDVYANSSLWVQMLEKAYAIYNKVYGDKYLFGTHGGGLQEPTENIDKGMKSMWRGPSYYFMNAMFSGIYGCTQFPNVGTNSIYAKYDDGTFINHPDYYLPEENKAFEAMKEFVNDKKEIVTVQPDQEADYGNDVHKVGIRNGHVYAIRKVFEKDGKKFVQLRDPYAMFMAGYDKDGKMVDKSQIVKGTLNSGTDTMGTFNLELKDFLKYFDEVQGASRDFCYRIGQIRTNGRDYDKYPISDEEKSDPSKYDDTIWREKEAALKAQRDSEMKKAPQEPAPAQPLSAEEQERAEQNRIEAERISAERQNSIVDNKLKTFVDSADKMAEFTRRINKYVQDFKAVDDIVGLANTKAYNDLREKVYVLGKTVNDMNEYKTIPNQDILKQKMTDVVAASDIYLSQKFKDVAERDANNKGVSERAVHRLAATINIKSVCTFTQPLSDWPGRKTQIARMYKKSLVNKIEGLRERAKEDPQAAKELKDSTKLLKALGSYDNQSKPKAERKQQRNL